jgi:nucleoside-diphosphate-sugar epimerase
MHIAMTGATGFVGRHTLEKLLTAGHHVKTLARKPGAVPVHASCTVLKGDLSDKAALGELTKKADVVLHIAGAISAPSRADFFRSNVEGTRSVAEATKASGVKRFVFVSSLAAREPDLNDYAASKAAAEHVIRSFEQDFEVTIIRPSAVYGPGDTATLPLLQSLLSQTAIIPGMRTARFSMVHVSDVSQVLLEACGGKSGLYELDDGNGGHNWPELIALTQAHFGTPRRCFYIPLGIAMAIGQAGSAWGRMRNKVALVNAGQIKQLYHPNWAVSGKPWPLNQRIPLAQGLPDTIRWYQAQGLLPLRSAADRSAANGVNT